MARQPHTVDVDVEQKRPEDVPYFPTSCSCGAWLRTHTSRSEALQAFFLHLRDPQAFGQRRVREGFIEDASAAASLSRLPEAAGVAPGRHYMPKPRRQ